MTSSTHEISETYVEKTWHDICDTDDDTIITELSQNFSAKQPALAEFIVASTEHLSDNAMELAFYIGFVVWRCYEGFFDGALRQVSPDEIVELAEKMEESIEEANPEEGIIENSSIFSSTQQHVWQYVVDAILEEDDDFILTDDEQASLFTALKIHIDCLSGAVKIAVN